MKKTKTTPKRYYYIYGSAFTKEDNKIQIALVMQAKDPEEAHETYVTLAHKKGMKEVIILNIELIDVI